MFHFLCTTLYMNIWLHLPGFFPYLSALAGLVPDKILSCWFFPLCLYCMFKWSQSEIMKNISLLPLAISKIWDQLKMTTWYSWIVSGHTSRFLWWHFFHWEVVTHYNIDQFIRTVRRVLKYECPRIFICIHKHNYSRCVANCCLSPLWLKMDEFNLFIIGDNSTKHNGTSHFKLNKPPCSWWQQRALSFAIDTAVSVSR